MPQEQHSLVPLDFFNMQLAFHRPLNLYTSIAQISGIRRCPTLTGYLFRTRRAISNAQMVNSPMRPRRFAPLDPAKRVDGDERPVLKGIVFDVDGTLCMLCLIFY